MLIYFSETNVEQTVEFLEKESESVPATHRTLIQRLAGIIYGLLGALLFTGPVFITKQLHVDLLDALPFRFFVQTLLILIYMKGFNDYSFYSKTTTKAKVLLFLNLFFAVTGFLSFFIGYRYLPLADLTTIRYTQIIWTAIIAAIIYRERPSIPTVFAMCLTLIGVVLVAQPKFDFQSERLIGLIIALYCSIAMSIMFIANKLLITKYQIKHGVIILQYTFVSFIIVSIHLIYTRWNRFESLLHWNYLYASLACLLQIISTELIQLSVKLEHPSIFTIVQSSEILFSILLQNLFSPIKSNLSSLIGSIVVLTSICIISISKFINEKQVRT